MRSSTDPPSALETNLFDAERRAVAVEAGATVVMRFVRYSRSESHGATRRYPEIGMGGHVLGGHSASSVVRSASLRIICTASKSSLSTRYWFRSPDALGDGPTTLSPRAPESITTFRAE